ncbi:hypothetical protein KA344_22315 [bacterium]|nr:hypothetical protein [bacterium]
MTTALETISKDLDWRESEIAGLRILLLSSAISEGQRKGLLRAAWAMLYAHYEGFCKESLTIFYNSICASGATCSELPLSTKLYALEKRMGHLRQMTTNDLLVAILEFSSCHLEKPPSFPDVDTQSNLWPNVLIDLLESADLSPNKVAEHQLKLKTLVSRRNEIAHGKNNLIIDVPYYLTFENAVYDVMYDLALQIENRLSMPPYSIS